jgi:hypothetical protein
MRDVRVRLPETAVHLLELNESARIDLSNRLATAPALEISCTVSEAIGLGIPVSEILPLTPLYLEFQ